MRNQTLIKAVVTGMLLIAGVGCSGNKYEVLSAQKGGQDIVPTAPSITYLKSNKVFVPAGAPVELQWWADGEKALLDGKQYGLVQSMDVWPIGTQVYKLVVNNAQGTATASLTLAADAVPVSIAAGDATYSVSKTQATVTAGGVTSVLATLKDGRGGALADNGAFFYGDGVTVFRDEKGVATPFVGALDPVSALATQGNYIYVLEPTRLRKFDAQGNVVGQVALPRPASAFAVTKDGQAYLTAGTSILWVTSDMQVETLFTGVNGVGRDLVNASGRCWLSDDESTLFFDNRGLVASLNLKTLVLQ